MITMQDNLNGWTAEVLRDLGRNDGADRTWRKAAIKMLMDKNHPFANHPDFRELRNEIKEEQAGQHEVESLIAQVEETPVVKEVVQKLDNSEAPTMDKLPVYDVVTGETKSRKEFNKEQEESGPFKASFTTRDM